MIVARGDCGKYSEKIRLLPFIKVVWAKKKKKEIGTEIDGEAAAMVFVRAITMSSLLIS